MIGSCIGRVRQVQAVQVQNQLRNHRAGAVVVSEARRVIDLTEVSAPDMSCIRVQYLDVDAWGNTHSSVH